MKELHFQRAGRMHVADEGPYRFAIWQSRGGPTGWSAAIFKREGRKEPWLQGHFRSKSEAIDWLSRYREPTREPTASVDEESF